MGRRFLIHVVIIWTEQPVPIEVSASLVGALCPRSTTIAYSGAPCMCIKYFVFYSDSPIEYVV